MEYIPPPSKDPKFPKITENIKIEVKITNKEINSDHMDSKVPESLENMILKEKVHVLKILWTDLRNSLVTGQELKEESRSFLPVDILNKKTLEIKNILHVFDSQFKKTNSLTEIANLIKGTRENFKKMVLFKHENFPHKDETINKKFNSSFDVDINNIIQVLELR